MIHDLALEIFLTSILIFLAVKQTISHMDFKKSAEEIKASNSEKIKSNEEFLEVIEATGAVNKEIIDVNKKIIEKLEEKY